MKFYLWIHLFAVVCITSCRSDFEFGRAVFDEDLDMEDALRELMISYDMSMSMSMSMSFSYGYGGGSGGTLHSGSSSDDGGGTSGVPGGSSGSGGSPNGSPGSPNGSSPTTSPSPASPTSSPVATPTMAPTTSTAGPTSATTAAPSTNTTTTGGPTLANELPTLSPTTDDDVVLSASLPSCFDFEASTFQSPLMIETKRPSVSFALLENLLVEAMREQLPFCEDLSVRRRRRGRRGRNLEETLFTSTSKYYIGNVILVGDSLDARCTPKFAGNNCFVAALTLRLFGNPTDEDIGHILDVIRGLLETDVSMGEALGAENNLVGPLSNSTESDANQGTGGGVPEAATSSRNMSAGRKGMISVLVIVVVGFVAVLAYRRFGPGFNEGYMTEDNQSEGHTLAMTAADRDRAFDAPHPSNDHGLL